MAELWVKSEGAELTLGELANRISPCLRSFGIPEDGIVTDIRIERVYGQGAWVDLIVNWEEPS